MQKILYVITKSNWGGAQRYVFDLATALPKDQFEVAVVMGGSGLLTEKLEAAGIRTISIESLVRDVSFFSDARAVRDLVRLFRRERPDVVHLNSSKAGGIGALAAQLVDVKKIIFTAHGWPFWENRNPVAKLLIWFFSWLTAFMANKTVVISDFDMRVVKKMPFVSHKVVRIYNGIAPIHFESGDTIRAAFPTGAKIIGTVGELNKNKNQVALIEQARTNPDMYVAIVGDGELRQKLETKIKEYKLGDRVKLFGFLPASEALKGFDVFALPSIKEGLPYVLLEAKQAGLPIVANRVGGVGEILDAKDMSEFTLERMVQKTAALY